MALSEETVETLDRVFQICRCFAECGDWACRGEAKNYPETKPKIDRLLQPHNPTDQKRAELEELAIMRFVDQGAVFCTPVELRYIDHRVVSILAVMQHYGAPTRLVDWSRSPWVAAFNACEKNSKCDGVIYTFHLPTVVEAAKSLTPVNRKAMFELSSDALDKWPDLTLGADDWVYPLMMRVSNSWMIAQQGFFTIAGRVNVDHIPLLAKLSSTTHPLHRFVIRKELKTPIMRQLVAMNITPASLYPGIQGVCRSIEQALEYKLPIIMMK